MEVDTPSDHDPDEKRTHPKIANLTSEFSQQLNSQNHGYHRKTQVVRLNN